MKKNSQIGILMATYNGENFIKEQINSILNQTYKNWKLIIHDDGSTDNTVKIIKEYAKEYPKQIILIEDNIKCGGAKENFSHLIKIVKKHFEFDYIMFSDQDDVWLPNKIEITLSRMMELEKINKGKPILVHTDLKVVDKDLGIIDSSFIKFQKLNLENQESVSNLCIENVITGCTMMINKKALFLIKEIPKEAIMHDWWIGIEILKNGGVINFIPTQTILYRQHESNDTGAKKINSLYYIRKIRNLRGAISSFQKIKKQCERAGIYIPTLIFLLKKFNFVLTRIFRI